MFHSAVEWTAAAITVQRVVRMRLAKAKLRCLRRRTAAATVIESAVWRCRAGLVLQCLRAAKEQRRTAAALIIQRTI